jgi:hypothetical protein
MILKNTEPFERQPIVIITSDGFIQNMVSGKSDTK